MVTMTTRAEIGRPFTVDDLDGAPDDGRRYEIIDGELLVSPAPGWPHQQVVVALTVLLHSGCPRDMRVLVAPFAVRPDVFTELQPDVVVARYSDLTIQNLPRPPLLAVEVISPSSRLIDSTLKRAAYARLGVASFWLVDPDPELPSLTVFELAEAEYRQIAQIRGSERFDAKLPFPVRVVPAELVAGLLP